MIASKGMMQSILLHYLTDLNAATRIDLYKGLPPEDSILQVNGFVYANRSADLLGTITIPTNSFTMQNIELEKKWRFIFAIGNHSGQFSANGEVGFAVIGNGQALAANVITPGTSDSEILRLNTTNAVLGQAVIASTFNLVIDRNIQL